MISWPLATWNPHLSKGQRFGVKRGNRTHNGIDIGKFGQAVLAAAAGLVSRVGYGSGSSGLMVFLRHGRDLETRYFHLLPGSVVVHPGQQVRRGQVIAAVGGSGIKVSAAHLHFEVLVRGSYVDPLKALGGNKMSYFLAFAIGVVLAAGGLYVGYKSGAL